MEAMLSVALSEFTIKTFRAIIRFYKEKYGTKKEDLEKGEGETLTLLSDFQIKGIVIENAYYSWLKGESENAINTIKNSGLFHDYPISNPHVVEWFSKNIDDVRNKILGSIRALRALGIELGYELYSIEVDLSLIPKVTITFQKSV